MPHRVRAGPASSPPVGRSALFSPGDWSSSVSVKSPHTQLQVFGDTRRDAETPRKRQSTGAQRINPSAPDSTSPEATVSERTGDLATQVMEEEMLSADDGLSESKIVGQPRSFAIKRAKARHDRPTMVEIPQLGDGASQRRAHAIAHSQSYPYQQRLQLHHPTIHQTQHHSPSLHRFSGEMRPRVATSSSASALSSSSPSPSVSSALGSAAAFFGHQGRARYSAGHQSEISSGMRTSLPDKLYLQRLDFRAR